MLDISKMTRKTRMEWEISQPFTVTYEVTYANGETIEYESKRERCSGRVKYKKDLKSALARTKERRRAYWLDKFAASENKAYAKDLRKYRVKKINWGEVTEPKRIRIAYYI